MPSIQNGRANGRLPDFLGVGPPRAATSWLDAVLRGHVGLPRAVKEVDFFVKNYARGIEWYKGYFRECDPMLPAGEICPSYFGSAEACARVAEHIPRCRIICTFRDPVDMMYSFYKLARRNVWTRADNFEAYRSSVLAQWGHQAQRLHQWRDTFGRDNVLVCVYDDLEADPQRYLDPVCDFIGIPRIQIAQSAIARQRINTFSREPRNTRRARRARRMRDWLEAREAYATVNLLTRVGFWRFCFEGGDQFERMSPELEVRLRRHLLPEIEALEQQIGRDLSAWKTRRAPAPATVTPKG